MCWTGTRRLEQVFVEIRKEIKRQGKNLTLLIEDVTAFTGVNVALLNVLTAADADIPSSFRGRSDVTGMESPRIRVGQTGQRGEDERPARQLHHRVGQRGFHHPLQFTAADMP